jgi:hypothetical protein
MATGVTIAQHGGEVNQGGPVGRRGKISCMDQDLETPGAPAGARRFTRLKKSSAASCDFAIAR